MSSSSSYLRCFFLLDYILPKLYVWVCCASSTKMTYCLLCTRFSVRPACCFLFESTQQQNAMQRVAPCMSLQNKTSGFVWYVLYCRKMGENSRFFSIFSFEFLQWLTSLPCSETSIISSNEVRTIYPIDVISLNPFFFLFLNSSAILYFMVLISPLLLFFFKSQQIWKKKLQGDQKGKWKN